MRRGSLFLHLAFLFSLQVSGHLSFALAPAKDQEQKTYPSSPEVKVPGQEAGLVERASVGRPTQLTRSPFPTAGR